MNDHEALIGQFQTFMILAVVLNLFVATGLAFWGYADAEKRGKSGCLVAIIVLCSFPLGLILWLLIRPEIEDRDR
jgi:hypothetical protein